MCTLERAHKRRRICVVMMSFSFIWSGKRTNPCVFVCVCVCVCVRFCVCIHPVEISIEKVTPLHSPRCYTLHILFTWVLVCQWDTSGTLVWRGWIGIKRGNAVWLKEGGIVCFFWSVLQNAFCRWMLPPTLFQPNETKCDREAEM